eukprot:evm.model.scf_964EXC.2 EVM.evm.TU.scf_964EXC.2   scf_964EXC:13025-13438(+)
MASAAEDDMFADSDAEPEAKTERGGAVQPPTADAPSPPGMPEAGKEALPEEGGKGAMRELKRARPEGDGSLPKVCTVADPLRVPSADPWRAFPPSGFLKLALLRRSAIGAASSSSKNVGPSGHCWPAECCRGLARPV